MINGLPFIMNIGIIGFYSSYYSSECYYGYYYYTYFFILEDVKIWEVAFGLENDILEAGAGSPADFVEHREECVIMLCDQVPFFCMAKSGKQLYKADEFRTKGNKSSAGAEVRGRPQHEQCGE